MSSVVETIPPPVGFDDGSARAGAALPVRAHRGGALPEMPQLDGLRAIAILFVLVSHFIAHSDNLFYWGSAGVRLFFVLSGFLITGILLQCRRATDDGSSTTGFELRQFYVRRALRILPAFYAVVLLAAVLNARIRHSLWWHLVYLSNIYFTRQGRFDSPGVHLWSLAVEEQFYLVWPWVILLVPRRLLTWVIVVTIGIAPIFRYVLLSRHIGSVGAWYLAPSNLDTLGLGAMLALAGAASVARRAALARWCGVFGLPLLVAVIVSQQMNRWDLFRYAAFNVAIGLCSVWLVGGAAAGFSGAFGRLLSAPPVMYVGRISYGIYLMHNFIRPIVVRGLLKAHVDVTRLPGVKFVLLCAATIGVASLSWHLFERPINALKRYFPYQRPRVTPRASTSISPIVQRTGTGC